jgi:hypothetical protein
MPRTKKQPKPPHERAAAFAHELEWTARRALVLRAAFPDAVAVRWRRSGAYTLILAIEPGGVLGRWYMETSALDAAAQDVGDGLVWLELAGLKPKPPEWLEAPIVVCANQSPSLEYVAKLQRERALGNR